MTSCASWAGHWALMSIPRLGAQLLCKYNHGCFLAGEVPHVLSYLRATAREGDLMVVSHAHALTNRLQFISSFTLTRVRVEPLQRFPRSLSHIALSHIPFSAPPPAPWRTRLGLPRLEASPAYRRSLEDQDGCHPCITTDRALASCCGAVQQHLR
jgi:hypothetical protein